MKFLDFFSGVGGFRLGFEMAGHECVGHVEWDKYAQQSYTAMHDVKEDEYVGWDIRAVRASELPHADCWNFGAPCQDFSIAGQRAGMEGDRSSLVREVFRLVRETEEENRPEWLLYENVKGMLSSNGGRDFLGIILEMDELGYDVEWQTLNSKNFGVPQNRERVFTLGHSRRYGGRKVFPIEGTDSEIGLEIEQIGQLDTDTRRNSNRYRVYNQSGLAPCLGTMAGGGLQPCTAINIAGTLTTSCNQAVILDDMYANREPRVYEDYAPTLRSDRTGLKVMQSVVNSITDEQGFAKRKSQEMLDELGYLPEMYNPYNKSEITDLAPTLTTMADRTTNSSTVLINRNLRIRKLTPKECWRLQGFPDEYFERAKASGVSDSQLYKQAGNSVTVNVIYEIARRLEVTK